MTLTLEEARALVALREGITEGPWRVVYERGTTQIKTANNESIMCDETYYPWVPENQNDWPAIAAVPDILDTIEVLIAEVERLREATNQCRLAFAGYVSVQSAVDKLDALGGDQ